MNGSHILDLHISIISDIIFAPFIAPLIKSYFGENTQMHYIPYGEHHDDEHLKCLGKSDLVIVWLNLESSCFIGCKDLNSQSEFDLQTVEKVLTLCKELYTDISAYSNAHILWFSFEDYFNKLYIVAGHNYIPLVDKLNIELKDALTSDVSFIDLKYIIAEIGITNAYDPKGKYRWNAPYSSVLVEGAVKEIHKQYLIEKGNTKKCLVLDCDNVLWGGILSEDGMENIQLSGSGFGRPYQDFQRYILSLFYHGVILALCSKNDMSDVLVILREHSEMILREEHIACFQVNWGNKAENIKRISETLNISLDSMVFVDDSPFEIEAVKSMLPEVTSVLYELDSVYTGLSCFNLKSNVSIADIEKRNKTYRTNQFREDLKSQYEHYDDYIASLDIKIDIHKALPIEYNRIAELTQRTNKCTNGKRYTVAEIKNRVVCKNVQLYSLSISDRFSDLGLVGALEVEGDTLTLCCLSCRALGRKIEGKMLEFIADKHQLHKIDFKSTGKNEDIGPIFLQVLPNVSFTNWEDA